MSLTINLPESWKEFLDAEVAAGDHGTVENYIQALLQDRKRRAREHVEALLEEGLNSDEVEWTPQVLADLKQEITEYHSKRDCHSP